MPHHARHDIESFFYVLLFITIMFMGPHEAISYKDCRTTGIFGKANDYHNLCLFASVKSMGLGDFDLLHKSLESMSPYFSDIKPLLVDLCSVVFDTSDDNIHVFKPRGTHSTFKQKLRVQYECLPRVTPADIPDNLYTLSKKAITDIAVKSNRSSHSHTQSTSYGKSSISGLTLDIYNSGQRPSLHPTGTSSIGSHSMSLRKRLNNNGSIHSSHHSSTFSSAMSQATMLVRQHENDPMKHTSDQSGGPHSPMVQKCLRSSGK